MLAWLLNLGFAGSGVPQDFSKGLQFTMTGYKLHYKQYGILHYTLTVPKIDYTVKG